MINKNMLHSMARSASDTSDDDFAPPPLLPAVPIHERPPNYWARLPEAVVEEDAVGAPAPPAPAAAANTLPPRASTFAHDMDSARKELKHLMAQQGHQAGGRHVDHQHHHHHHQPLTPTPLWVYTHSLHYHHHLNPPVGVHPQLAPTTTIITTLWVYTHSPHTAIYVFTGLPNSQTANGAIFMCW